MVRMAVSEARFPLGPPASRILAWFAFSCVLLPLPFLWAPTVVFYGAMGVAFVLAVGFAVAHRIRSKPRGWVSADQHGIARVMSGKRNVVAKFAEPFGVTLLAAQARQRALLAVTTPTETRFIGVRLEGAAASLLLDRASIVADGDALAAHASDEETLSASDALSLLKLIRERAPLAPHRLYLSGTRGEQIILDGTELRVEGAERSRLFDLDSPVEWRGFLFHEALGPAASIYQATWIRQGSSELVLVAPMPTELLLTTPKPQATSSTVAARHKQILSPAPDEPPPGDLRTGIERVFMLPVREALAKAPRPSRSPKRRHASTPDLGA